MINMQYNCVILAASIDEPAEDPEVRRRVRGMAREEEMTEVEEG